MPPCWTKRRAAVHAVVPLTGHFPAPLVLPVAAPPALRLVALVLATHVFDADHHSADLDVVTRLCGHSPQQTKELLDRLVSARTLSVWHHHRETDEVFWKLPPQPAYARSTVRPGRRHTPPPGS